MSQNTRTHRASPRSSATVRAAGRGSSAIVPRAGGRAPARNTTNHIIGGSLLLLVGLGWAMGLALTPGGHDRQLLLSVLPWLLVVAGAALGIYGFSKVGSSPRT